MSGAASRQAGATPAWGLAAVLLGTFLSTLNTRLSTFGLNDIRGAMHAGFDEGAWITTAQTTGQMLVLPAAIWLGNVFGARKVLLNAAVAFAVISLAKPLSPNLPTFLALQFAGGVASGFFIPLTLSFILITMPPRLWAVGVALYALNLELSLNISASVEGFFVDYLSWRWIFWQSVPLSLAMAACLYFDGSPIPPSPAKPQDIFGLVLGGVGLALIYAALDQGNRLDWLNSGLVWGLLVAGAIGVAALLLHEARTPHPLIDLKVLMQPPFASAAILIGVLRLTILSTAYLVPTFLGAVRGFRSIQMGQTLAWIAVPQFLVCVFAAMTLRRIDARFSASLGFICVAVSCLMVAHGLTSVWGEDQFWPALLLQAVGQSFAMTGIIFYIVQHVTPAAALTVGGLLQSARLMGGEVGQAFAVTFVRIRSQLADNLIGLHVQTGEAAAELRMRIYGAATASLGDASVLPRGAMLLGDAVRRAATTQAIIDASLVMAVFAALGILLLMAQKAPPPNHPAAPRLLSGLQPGLQA